MGIFNWIKNIFKSEPTEAQVKEVEDYIRSRVGPPPKMSEVEKLARERDPDIWAEHDEFDRGGAKSIWTLTSLKEAQAELEARNAKAKTL